MIIMFIVTGSRVDKETSFDHSKHAAELEQDKSYSHRQGHAEERRGHILSMELLTWGESKLHLHSFMYSTEENVCLSPTLDNYLSDK